MQHEGKTVNTGWRTVTPGECFNCGCDDDWHVDGRGNIMCGCQACPDCGILDAEGFHEEDCPQLASNDPGSPHWDDEAENDARYYPTS